MSELYRKRPLKQYRYLVFLSMLFITIFVCCDTTAFQMVYLHGHSYPLSGFIIPLVFAIGDIMAEVYGYHITMMVLRNAIICQLIYGLLLTSVLHFAPLPPHDAISHSYGLTFLHLLRASFTSCFSVTLGMLANAFLISYLKVYMHGKRFWARTIISCAFSEFVLCTVAYLILFSGLKSFADVVRIIYSIWIFKILFSVAITPITSAIARLLKYLELSDVYDIDISYNPFVKPSQFKVMHFDLQSVNDEHYEGLN